MGTVSVTKGRRKIFFRIRVIAARVNLSQHVPWNILPANESRPSALCAPLKSTPASKQAPKIAALIFGNLGYNLTLCSVVFLLFLFVPRPHLICVDLRS